MLDFNNKLWVIDFGLSRTLKSKHDSQNEIKNFQRNIDLLIAMIMMGQYGVKVSKKRFEFVHSNTRLYSGGIFRS
jgi:hypothetical protein